MGLDHRPHILAQTFFLRVDGRVRHRPTCSSRRTARTAAKTTAERAPGKPVEVLAVVLGGERILVDAYARHPGELRHIDVAQLAGLYVLP